MRLLIRPSVRVHVAVALVAFMLLNGFALALFGGGGGQVPPHVERADKAPTSAGLNLQFKP